MKKILYILVFLTLCIGIDRISAYTEYKIGDVVPYNGMNFYVIKNSDSKDDTVTLLKAEPLTVDEVTTYGVGHINRYTSSSQGVAYNQNGYGGMTYYSSDTCKSGAETGCTSDYDDSDIKYAVDAWANNKFNEGVLKTDTLGYKARLLTFDELTDNLGYEYYEEGTLSGYRKLESTPSWVYNSSYSYWTISPYQDDASRGWGIRNNDEVFAATIWNCFTSVVRPVITLKKTALGDEDESIIDDKEKEDTKIDAKDNLDDNKSNESKTIVKVDNTYMSSSILLIILGFITASISVLIIYKFSNKKR